MYNIFTVFTKAQQRAIDLMIEYHTLNHDDIGEKVSRYMLNKMVEMGVFDYDKMDEFWDFSSAFYSYLVTMGVIDEKSGERQSVRVNIEDVSDSGEVLSEAPKEAITEEFQTLGRINMAEHEYSMPLMGERTIAEVVEMLEKTGNVRVTKAVLVDGIVTLTYELHSEPDYPECPDCGQSLDTEWELKNGRCSECSVY